MNPSSGRFRKAIITALLGSAAHAVCVVAAHPARVEGELDQANKAGRILLIRS